MIKPLLKTAINTTTPTAIVDPNSDGEPLPYWIVPEDNSDFYIGTKADGSDEVRWRISSANYPNFSMRIHPDSDGTIMYIRGTTSTNIILIRYPG